MDVQSILLSEWKTLIYIVHLNAFHISERTWKCESEFQFFDPSIGDMLYLHR